jgi:hypothetical protein
MTSLNKVFDRHLVHLFQVHFLDFSTRSHRANFRRGRVTSTCGRIIRKIQSDPMIYRQKLLKAILKFSQKPSRTIFKYSSKTDEYHEWKVLKKLQVQCSDTSQKATFLWLMCLARFIEPDW